MIQVNSEATTLWRFPDILFIDVFGNCCDFVSDQVEIEIRINLTKHRISASTWDTSMNTLVPDTVSWWLNHLWSCHVHYLRSLLLLEMISKQNFFPAVKCTDDETHRLGKFCSEAHDFNLTILNFFMHLHNVLI